MKPLVTNCHTSENTLSKMPHFARIQVLSIKLLFFNSSFCKHVLNNYYVCKVPTTKFVTNTQNSLHQSIWLVGLTILSLSHNQAQHSSGARPTPQQTNHFQTLWLLCAIPAFSYMVSRFQTLCGTQKPPAFFCRRTFRALFLVFYISIFDL